MKIFKYILILSLLVSGLRAQNIVTNAFVTQGIVFLGSDANVTFNVNKITQCDSYSADWDINYVAKIININLTYNYFSNCTASNITSFESTSKPILLEGTYWVNLNVNVPNNPFLNQSINLTSIFVNKPQQLTCVNSFIPFLFGFCPSLFNQVCACNGVTYQNECKAYLEDRNGLYESGICPEYINRKMIPFQCKTFYKYECNSTLFAKYICSNEVFEEKELILKYEHNQTSDYKLEYFTQTYPGTVFLTKIKDNNLECIASTKNGLLEVSMLPAGAYYLIVENLYHSITFCTRTNTEDTIAFNTMIYPNPASDIITVKSNLDKIYAVSLLDHLGKHYHTKYVKDYEGDLQVSDLSRGMYILKIQLENGHKVIKKLILN